MKYDSQLNFSTSTSDGNIISKITPNSTILEFGCAYGKMTKYMSDALGCDVYIVEYDQEAYKSAVRFAKDGVCGDAMELEWVRRFGDIRFDYIIFADVLEHLTDPEIVLKNAAGLLKTDGRIYISIPNITHNDIIAKAMKDHFDYTDIGLLDNTHVHFWGRENLVPFAEKCGLHVSRIEATYCGSGMTEQSCNGRFECEDNLVKNYLRERPYGEVYQYIMTLTAEDSAESAVDTAAEIPFISSNIYFDAGRGFNQADIISFSSQMISSGLYNAHYVFSDTSSVTRVRFDPLEGQNCILQNVVFRQGDRKLSGTFVCGIDYGAGILMCSTDPQVIVDITSGEPLIIDADIMIPSQKMLEEMESSIENSAVANRRFSERIADAEAEKSRLSAQLQELCQEKTQMIASMDKISEELQGSNVHCCELENRIVSLENELAEEQKKSHETGLELSEKSRVNGSLKEELELCRKDNAVLNKKVEVSEAALDDMQSENDVLSEKIDALLNSIDKAEAQEKEQTAIICSLRTQLNSYISLYQEKEKLLIGMESKLNALNAEKSELEGFCSECDRLNNEISLILNRRLIRYGDKLLKFPKKVAGLFKKKREPQK